jgi:predicted DCC family thiol-disulfide oxidoreductase YuxK
MGQRILFFDGVCNLCNGFVDFLIRKDRDQNLHFAALQGATAKAKIPESQRHSLHTVVLLDENQIYTQSDAALKTLGYLPGPWCGLAFLRVIPKFLRDPVYALVSRWRYRLFGRRDTCRVPTPAERTRFLD